MWTDRWILPLQISIKKENKLIFIIKINYCRLHCTMRFLLWRSVNRKIYQNVYLGPHFHFHFLICLVFPGIPLVKIFKKYLDISTTIHDEHVSSSVLVTQRPLNPFLISHFPAASTAQSAFHSYWIFFSC